MLYDLTGRKVYELEMAQPEQLIEPGNHLAPGFHILQVGKGEALRHYRLLKFK
ncbi:T9SS type A sorting domain-containing protein [Larkinella arboricola]|uniref:T9SS type A sorting domain-containing protein n=1 Tax=Larkinella arboricola TaxID=643671 RepID=UPI0035B64A81